MVFHLYGSFYGLWGLCLFWMLYHNIRIGTVAHRCDISCVFSDRRMKKMIFHILNIGMAFLLSEFECVVANKLDASKNNRIDCNEITFLLYEQLVCDFLTPIWNESHSHTGCIWNFSRHESFYEHLVMHNFVLWRFWKYVFGESWPAEIKGKFSWVI